MHINYLHAYFLMMYICDFFEGWIYENSSPLQRKLSLSQNHRTCAMNHKVSRTALSWMQPEATSETGGKTRCPGTSARRKISPIRWLADRVLPPGSLEGFFFGTHSCQDSIRNRKSIVYSVSSGTIFLCVKLIKIKVGHPKATTEH